MGAHPSGDQERLTTASGLVFVLSGPAGVGKSTLIELLQQDEFPITYCVTATTRARRPGEAHGVHYAFVSDEEFDALLEHRELIEHALVHGTHRYGIPRAAVRAGLNRGQDLIITPDVQGAETIRQNMPGVITIFLWPTSVEQLREQLVARATETDEQRGVRLADASGEMAKVSEYDYVIVSRRNQPHEALRDLKAIIVAERLRVHPRTVTV